jgi:hypothetical protein
MSQGFLNDKFNDLGRNQGPEPSNEVWSRIAAELKPKRKPLPIWLFMAAFLAVVTSGIFVYQAQKVGSNSTAPTLAQKTNVQSQDASNQQSATSAMQIVKAESNPAPANKRPTQETNKYPTNSDKISLQDIANQPVENISEMAKNKPKIIGDNPRNEVATTPIARPTKRSSKTSERAEKESSALPAAAIALTNPHSKSLESSTYNKAKKTPTNPDKKSTQLSTNQRNKRYKIVANSATAISATNQIEKNHQRPTDAPTKADEKGLQLAGNQSEKNVSRSILMKILLLFLMKRRIKLTRFLQLPNNKAQAQTKVPHSPQILL